MKKEKIIEVEKGDIIAVLASGFSRRYFSHTLIRDLNSKNVLIFCRGAEKFSYYPCKMAVMDYGYDLIEMAKDYAKDYTIGIINSLKEKFNTKETIEFIKTLKQDKKLKNKTFVLIICLDYNQFKRHKRLTLDDYEDYKEAIEECCNKVYTFYKKFPNSSCRYLTVENLKNESKRYYFLKDIVNDNLIEITQKEYNKAQW